MPPSLSVCLGPGGLTCGEVPLRVLCAECYGELEWWVSTTWLDRACSPFPFFFCCFFCRSLRLVAGFPDVSNSSGLRAGSAVERVLCHSTNSQYDILQSPLAALQLTVILRRREKADMQQRKKLVSEQLDITSWQDLDDPKGSGLLWFDVETSSRRNTGRP